jgi:acyl dehydratase
VTEQEIVAFAKEYDPQRFHINKEEAEKTIFKGLIASGWQTCSFMMRMLCDGFLLESSSLGAPGLENINWHKPVKAGDVLRVRVEVLGVRPMNSKPHIGMVHFSYECFNQNDEKVTSMQGWGMFLRRESNVPSV